MKYNELIDNKIYVTSYEDQGDYIFKQNSNNLPKESINKGSFSKRTGLHNQNGFIDYREATSQEIKWLETCIKENRYIPFEDIKFNSELEIEIW